MSSDNFDKKIKDSLDQRPHAFEEASWHKMEKMLDKHLPQKKDDRRKLILLIFLFLVAGGGTVLLLNGNIFNKESKETSKLPSTTTHTPNKVISETILIDDKAVLSSKKVDENTNFSSFDQDAIKNKENPSVVKERSFVTNLTSKPSIPELLKSTKKTIQTPFQKAEKEITKSSDGNNNFNNITTNEKLTISDSGINKKENQSPEAVFIKDKESIPAEDKPITDNEKNVKNPSPETIKPSSKNKRSFPQNIFLTVSMGPDISSVGSNTGKVKLSMGAGIGYKISERFTLRSGFYVVKKVYTADPKDYNPPSDFWAYYPNLKQIDAVCKVYEIPIVVDYNFGRSKNQHWFISAGVSSLLMKNEDYNYYYKPAYSTQYVYNSKTYKNQNKHYFSQLNFSGGYNRKISSILTLQAEPYFKVAMDGVGYGKVKLNSGGILFTANFQPFRSKNIKPK